MLPQALQLLPPPDYSEDERRQIVKFLFAFTKNQIEPFFREIGISPNGSKAELRNRLESRLNEGAVSYSRLIAYIDLLEPWGAQHVYLLNGPKLESWLLDGWRVEASFHSLLKKNKVIRFLNNRLPLILPENLSLSSIEHRNDRLRVTAVEKRESFERDEDLDSEENSDGDKVEYRAFRRIVTRGIISFEWQFGANIAMLQISQLPTRFTYEDAYKRFYNLIRPWLDLSMFEKIDMRPAIGYLHKTEGAKHDEIRSHGIEYISIGGRRLSGKSASSQHSLLGEQVIDNALNNVRDHGTGQSGNFFFLPSNTGSVHTLSAEVHCLINAEQSRVNFPTDNTEEDVRYVLRRIRQACRRPT